MEHNLQSSVDSSSGQNTAVPRSPRVAATRRQVDVLAAIRSYILTHGYSPSFTEIGRLVGLSSLATVHKHVRALIRKGLIHAVFNSSRSISLTQAGDSAIKKIKPRCRHCGGTL